MKLCDLPDFPGSQWLRYRLKQPLARLPAVVIVACLCVQPSLYAAAPIPDYIPKPVSPGIVRIYGSDLNGQVAEWEDAFARLQPGVKFKNRFPSSDGWSAGMEAAGADIGSSGREPVLVEYLSFNETFGYGPTEVAVATGSYDQPGKSWAVGIYVHKDNPLTRLTLNQLDGIFGSERSGGYQGMKWLPQLGRSPERNIRTWGELGLTGEWADKPIQTYGYAYTGMSNFFQLKVFHNGDKWNPNYRQYVEAGTKMVSNDPIGRRGSIRYMLSEELSKDRYGIAWTGVPQAAGIPQVKLIALAATEGTPYVSLTRASVQDRSYPLTRSVYLFLNRAPGKPVAPRVREFMRFVLSRQGQEAVARHNAYLPLPAATVRDELKKVE